MRNLVASFGFDMDFVVRRLAAKKYDKVVLVALKTDEGFEKVKKAYSALSIVCNSLKVDCVLEPVSPSTLFKSVHSILLYEAKKVDELEVFLTGGPRMLVVALLLSTLLIPKEHISKVSLVVEGEGFDCTATINASMLLDVLSLDERDKAIISALESEELTLSEISRRTEIPKSTVHRRLEELVKKGLVVKREAEAYVAKLIVDVVCSM